MNMQLEPEKSVIRKVGGTMYVKVPAWLSKKLDYNDGDEVLLSMGADKKMCVEKLTK